jgi:drug/metabolite transporter (DMT)-like permease
MSHASIFNSLGGAVIVLVNHILRRPVHRLEIIGTLIALIGCSVVLCDGNAEKVDAENQNIPLGDAIGILGSVSAALYFT